MVLLGEATHGTSEFYRARAAITRWLIKHHGFTIVGEPRCLVTALTGGDDYEILFTAPSEATARIRELWHDTGVPIRPIGRMTALSDGEQPGVVVLDDTGRPIRFASEGWTHFRSIG